MDDGDVEVPAGFRLVADETRAAILYALAERRREHPGEPAMGFSELRRAVGMRDSGNFNYHLDKLLGRFVEKTEGGYVLTYPGTAVVAALVGGGHEAAGSLGPEPYGDPCPLCGETLAVRYDDGMLSLACEGDDTHGITYSLPPHAVDGDDLPAAADLMARRAYAETALVADDRCPMCFGTVDLSTVDLPDEDLPPAFDAACRRCGMHYTLTVGLLAVHHPEVAGFLVADGDSLPSSPTALLGLGFDVDAEPAAEDDAHEVTFERGGETLTVTVDDDGAILDLGREG